MLYSRSTDDEPGARSGRRSLRLRAVRVAKHINKAVQIATFAQFLGWILQYCPWRESTHRSQKWQCR
jgi:hypothetical protein